MTQRTAWLRDRLTHRINGTVQRCLQTDGVDVPGEEWDTLVVLDACRSDLYHQTEHPVAERFDSEGSVISQASSTDEWLRRTWPKQYPDTVYVAGNPLVSRHAADRWHHLDAVWSDAWNENDGTIPAEPITDAALNAHQDFPNKRVVVHYLQPHAPLIALEGDGFDGWQGFSDLEDKSSNGYKNVWVAASDGAFGKRELWKRYQETLSYVLDEVDRLLEEIDGRVVVTSDHGNCIGERGWPLPIRQWGHPPGLRQSAVRSVPWLIREGDRREVMADDVGYENVAEPTERQLDALGYV